MMKYLSLFAILLSANLVKAQNINSPAVAAVPSQVFNYQNRSVGYYSLGWYDDTWDGTGPTTYLSGYNGLKVFARGQYAMGVNPGGNVGIGTANPYNRLDVNGGIGFANQNAADKKLYSPIDGVLEWMTHNSAGEHGFAVSHQGSRLVFFNTSGPSYFNGGNLGIGTTTPAYLLDTYGNARFDNSVAGTAVALNDGGAAFALLGGGAAGSMGAPEGKFPLRLYEGYGWNFTLQNIINHPANGAYSALRVKSYDDNTLFQVRADGNVGIGTESPTERLSVNGKIRAKEIKVEANWSDFVFEPGYYNRPLNEVEAYVAQNRHLPDIPSAKEVEKNGVNVGEINAKLLQKIEELTLHLIEMNKRIKELEKNQKK